MSRCYFLSSPVSPALKPDGFYYYGYNYKPQLHHQVELLHKEPMIDQEWLLLCSDLRKASLNVLNLKYKQYIYKFTS